MKNHKRNSKKSYKLLGILAIVFIILYSVLYYFYVIYIESKIDYNYEAERTEFTDRSQTVESVLANNKKISDMIELASSSVVGISKFKNNSNSIFSNDSSSYVGVGTGVIVSDNGYILSNSHVTGEKYSSCYVTLENGNTYSGKVVWSDTNLDLSISKINEYSLTPAILGDSSSIRAGETVFAIGNPIGFEFKRTVTSGIVSAINRTIKLEENNSVSYMTDLIQTDATINPGNSGGPLLLPNGNIIGVNTVKITSAEGIGFAVPINVIKPVIESFIKMDAFEEASIGIYAYDSNVIPYLSSTANSFSNGIYVVQILPSGPAFTTALKEGDIINSIDGIELNTMNDLRAYIYTKKPYDTVVLSVSRGKISKEISIVLGKR